MALPGRELRCKQWGTFHHTKILRVTSTENIKIILTEVSLFGVLELYLFGVIGG